MNQGHDYDISITNLSEATYTDTPVVGDAALAADQLPTAGHDQQPQETTYTYPTPRPGGGLGF